MQRLPSRRAFLGGFATASVVGTAGCLDLGSDSRNPVTVGRIKVGNAEDEPARVSVLLRSSEEIFYWNTFDLAAHEVEEGQVQTEWDSGRIVEGPWQDEPAVVDAVLRYEPEGGGGTTERLALGEDHEGCLTLQIDIFEGFRPKISQNDQPCSIDEEVATQGADDAE